MNEMDTVATSTPDLFLYTDGGCRAGFGSWAVVAEEARKPDQFVTVGVGTFRNTTHQRMELTAALMAVRWLEEEAPTARAEIRSDSFYLVGCFVQAWHIKWRHHEPWRKASGGEVKHIDLWRPLLDTVFALPNTPQFRHIPGHKGIPGNARVDWLCTDAIRRAPQG